MVASNDQRHVTEMDGISVGLHSGDIGFGGAFGSFEKLV